MGVPEDQSLGQSPRLATKGGASVRLAEGESLCQNPRLATKSRASIGFSEPHCMRKESLGKFRWGRLLV
jgi:hypothetical protein